MREHFGTTVYNDRSLNNMLPLYFKNKADIFLLCFDTCRNTETTNRAAKEANFAALFVRDVLLNDPSFGDVGQMYDPWVFLSYVEE